MHIPHLLLRLFQMWDYICPKCKKEVAKNSRKCVHCGEHFANPLRVPPNILKDPKTLEDYVHTHIFPRISAKQKDYLAQFFTELFSDGFESGDFSAWTGTSGTCAIVTDPVHHGTYAAKFGTWNTYAYKTFTGQTTVFARMYFQLPSLPASDGAYDLVLWLRGGGNTIATLYVRYVTDHLALMLVRNNPYGTVYYTYAFQANTWYCLELKFVKDASVGEYRVWLDGSEVITQTGLNTNGNADADELRVGQCERSIWNDYTYVDCVVVADTYIGTEAEEILKEVADSLSFSDGTLCNKTLTLSDTIATADLPLKDWTPTITDSISLSEIVEIIASAVIKYVTGAIALTEQIKINKVYIVLDTINVLDRVFGHRPFVTVSDALALAEMIVAVKTIALMDQVALSDMALILKQLRVIDAVNLMDAVSTPTRVLHALDSVGLSENAYVSKILVVSDQMVLAETVEKVVAGGVRTRIFLVLGDFAVQLTG